MGGGPKQVNTAQATAANTGATGAAQNDLTLSKTNAAAMKYAVSKLFGYNTDSGQQDGEGSLTGFMDHSNVDSVNKPTGVYRLQYNNQAKTIDNAATNASGTIAREAANRGFGLSSNFSADQARKSYLDAAAAKGGAFADTTGRQYADAQQNFWNANNILAGQGAQAGSNAIQASSNAGNTYANLYGVAGRQAQPSGLLNSAIGAAGTVGAGAFMCVVEDSLIELKDGGKKKVQDLDLEDEIAQVNGKSAKLKSLPQIAVRECCEVVTNNEKKGRASLEHTYMVQGGGYVHAGASMFEALKTDEGFSLVSIMKKIGRKAVYFLDIGGNHTYCADGIWSLV